ncbi:hypothetical protein FB45DRAFT_877500 [Roridomyces roridus]|uniref:Uncharacterized protein n=1 Tax=Roridomyces roridus TaxID=1738132 RepID=A0AAD7F834_9AGAR|nr:hypothetical protein FB45DRAFT_877500 [Roridomyces roridus]
MLSGMILEEEECHTRLQRYLNVQPVTTTILHFLRSLPDGMLMVPDIVQTHVAAHRDVPDKDELNGLSISRLLFYLWIPNMVFPMPLYLEKPAARLATPSSRPSALSSYLNPIGCSSDAQTDANDVWIECSRTLMRTRGLASGILSPSPLNHPSSLPGQRTEQQRPTLPPRSSSKKSPAHEHHKCSWCDWRAGTAFQVASKWRDSRVLVLNLRYEGCRRQNSVWNVELKHAGQGGCVDGENGAQSAASGRCQDSRGVKDALRARRREGPRPGTSETTDYVIDDQKLESEI